MSHAQSEISRALTPQRRAGMGFQRKILLAFLTLLALSAGAAMFAVNISSTEYFSNALDEQLRTGREVMLRHLNNREAQLAISVQVLVNDFGFKSAVATNDRATIDSVLENHASRIGADLAILTDVDGYPLSATDRSVVVTGEAVSLPAGPEEAGRIENLGGKLYQSFTLPVEVPDHIGWIIMAFRIDQSVSREVGALTNLEFSALDLTAPETGAVSTRPNGLNTSVALGRNAPALRRALARNTDFSSAVVPLNKPQGGHIVAVLQAPTDYIAEATGGMLQQLASIFAATLCLCVLASMWLARRISNPVGELIAAARRIRMGDYDKPVEVHAAGELALLGSALNNMVTAVAEREEEIARQAFTEPVTGMPNRNRFLQDYKILQGLLGEQTRFCLTLLTIADWRDVNFSYGAAVSDAFKRTVAEHLSQRLPQHARLYAFDASLFAIVMPEADSRSAQHRGRTLVKDMQQRFPVDQWTVSSRCAGSVIQYPDEASDPGTLLHRAESTLDRAVAQRTLCLTYLAEEEETRRRQLDIIAAFDGAFANNEFHLVYQPKVTVRTGAVQSAEALLRWIQPELGFIPPDEFIQLAERSGNIRALTTWVLREAVSQAATWTAQNIKLSVAINISAHDLADPTLCQDIQTLLEETGCDGRSIALEITESAVLMDEARAVQALVRLKRMGIRLSIDDFGTGFSSLAQLKKLPVDELKIDKSFVMELDTSADDLQIVRSTVELGHNLGLSIVAEGVENQESFELLRHMHCDRVQGYHFSKPLKADEFIEWRQKFASLQLLEDKDAKQSPAQSA